MTVNIYSLNVVGLNLYSEFNILNTTHIYINVFLNFSTFLLTKLWLYWKNTDNVA